MSSAVAREGRGAKVLPAGLNPEHVSATAARHRESRASSALISAQQNHSS